MTVVFLSILLRPVINWATQRIKPREVLKILCCCIWRVAMARYCLSFVKILILFQLDLNNFFWVESQPFFLQSFFALVPQKKLFGLLWAYPAKYYIQCEFLCSISFTDRLMNCSVFFLAPALCWWVPHDGWRLSRILLSESIVNSQKPACPLCSTSCNEMNTTKITS